MPSINSLPNELVSLVIDNLDFHGDIAALARTNYRLHQVANPILYKAAIDRGNAWPLAFGARYGVAGTVRNIIEAGADPNHQFDETKLVRDWAKMTKPRRAAPPPTRTPLPYASYPMSGTDSEAAAGNVAGDWEYDDFENSDLDALDLDGPDGLNPWHLPPDLMDLYYDDVEDEWDNEDDEELEDLDSSDSDSDADSSASSTLGSEERLRDTDRRFTALHLAARKGHNEVVEVLLEYGASINSPSTRLCQCNRAAGLLNSLESPEREEYLPKWTPLHMAICSSHVQTAKLLLARGASINMEMIEEKTGSPSQLRPYDITALHQAAGFGQVELVKHLVEKNYQTDLEIRDKRSLTPFYYAYANKRWPTTIPLLLKMGADINVEIQFYQPYCVITPLGEAVRLGHFDVAQKLVDIGADPFHGFVATGAGHRKGLSPLHLGCMRSARKAGVGDFVDAFEEDKAGERMSIMETFIAKGADVHSTDCNGDTPLLSAATNRVLPAVRALIKAGADVQVRNALGRTVVMQAVIGAPPQKSGPRSDEGRRDAGLSMIRIIPEILDHLFRAGAKIDDVDPQGNTVLHVLLADDHISHEAQIMQLHALLNRAGAVDLLSVKNNDGHTPFQVAFYKQRGDVYDILIRQQRNREAFPPAEILKMFEFAVDNGSPILMDEVLDLDMDRVILSDAALFERLCARCKWIIHSTEPDSALTAVKTITSRGLPPMAPDLCTRLLRRALRAGCYDFARQLMDRGADVNAVDGDGELAPLSQHITTAACHPGIIHSRAGIYSHHHVVVVEWEPTLFALLDRGADIHYSQPDPPSLATARPLNLAITVNNSSIVCALLASQPLTLAEDPRAKGGYYLHHAFNFQLNVVTERDIIDKLIASGADIAELDEEGNFPAAILIRTLTRQPYEISEYHHYLCPLLERGLRAGVDVNRPNNKGQSIATLLQTLLENKHARNYLGWQVEVIDTPDGGKELRFPTKRLTSKSLKLLKDIQDQQTGFTPAPFAPASVP